MSFQDSIGLRWHPRARPIRVWAPLMPEELLGPYGRVRIADVEHLHAAGVSLQHSGREWLLTPEEARTLAHLLGKAADEAER